VNPGEESILGFKCYQSLSEITCPVELIVIIVPAKIVPSIMEQAAAKKVKTAIIISSGFKEVGNVELEQQVLDISRNAGIRVLGQTASACITRKTA